MWPLLTAWEETKTRALRGAVRDSPLLTWQANSPKKTKERFLCPAQSQAILPLHTVGVQLQLISLPGKSFIIAGNSSEDPDVLRFYELVMVEPIFCHRRFVWRSKPYMPEVIFYSGLCRSTSLSDLHLTTLTGYTAHSRSPQTQVGRRKLEVCLGGSPTHLMLCLANILLSRSMSSGHMEEERMRRACLYAWRF